MNTFIFSPQTANVPIHDLLSQVANGSVEILDVDGNIIAYVLSPDDRGKLTYAEARLDFDQHREEVSNATSRRGGITTKQLLENAKSAVHAPSLPS